MTMLLKKDTRGCYKWHWVGGGLGLLQKLGRELCAGQSRGRGANLRTKC